MNLLRKRPSRALAVFLTGVTGFLGGAFLADLLDSGFDDEVVCLVRAEDQDCGEERVRRSLERFGPLKALPRNVKVLRGDVTKDDWHHARELNGITHVLHLAASTSFGSNNGGIFRTNVDGAVSVAKAMRGRSLHRYVHTGTATICGAFPPHIVHEDTYPSDEAAHLLPYTRSKAEAERRLENFKGDLPLVVARPSIVVGHTRQGCKPSGSIFWVLRTVEALRFITWDPQNRVDVIPVDWASAALRHLLFASHLQHDRYHISAGTGQSVRWEELGAEYARLLGGPVRDRYEVGQMSQLTTQRIAKATGASRPRHIRLALELYARFCSLDLVFDNQRLLAEGFAPPPRFTDYMQVCLESSPASIYEQMCIDVEPAAPSLQLA